MNPTVTGQALGVPRGESRKSGAAGGRPLNPTLTGKKRSRFPPAAVPGPKRVVPGCHHGPGPPLLGASCYCSRTGFFSFFIFLKKSLFFSWWSYS